MHKKQEILATLKTFFHEMASVYKIEMAFLYGLWARGFPKKLLTWISLLPFLKNHALRIKHLKK